MPGLSSIVSPAPVRCFRTFTSGAAPGPGISLWKVGKVRCESSDKQNETNLKTGNAGGKTDQCSGRPGSD